MTKYTMTAAAAKRIAQKIADMDDMRYKGVINLLKAQDYSNPGVAYQDVMRFIADDYPGINKWMGYAAAQEAHYLANELSEVRNAVSILGRLIEED